MEEYLKIPEVLEAFHVRSVFFEVDNAEGDFDYTPTEPNLSGFYQQVNGKLRVLVCKYLPLWLLSVATIASDLFSIISYLFAPFFSHITDNGDTDPAITSFATSNWTSHLGFSETQHWRPWTVDGCRKTEGYVVRYKGNFDFLTIRGAGHMVPTYKPAATFAFLKAWIEGKDYPIFDANCTAPETRTISRFEPSVSAEVKL